MCQWMSVRLVAMVVLLACGAASATAAATDEPRAPGVAGVAAVPRLHAADLGLVINVADPYSVAVGAFYVEARQLLPQQVLRVVLPVQSRLDGEEFDLLAAQIGAHFGEGVQALALAWRRPYGVGCQSITGALALGRDVALCAHSCAPTPTSPYFNAGTARPWRELRLRPSMLLAAADAAGARTLITRGVASDGQLGRRGGPPVVARFVETDDAARAVRSRFYPPAGLLRGRGVRIVLGPDDGREVLAEPTLVYQTGAVGVTAPERLGLRPGSLADHLTSFGGQLDGDSGQMTALAWIAAGATASYGTVSEPCAHAQKFPHPQVLLRHYLQGSTAIEAYWKSVAWPSQGLFIGEPLAAPFAR